MKSNNNGTPPTYVDMNEQAQSPKSLAPATLWLLFNLLLCFILMATFFTLWLMMLQWTRKWIRTTRRQRRRQQLTWKYIYDSDRDKVLTWNNKQYVYPTRKKVNGHWNGIPLQGHWHGSSFMDHSNLPTESKENKRHHHAPATLDAHTSKPQHPQASLPNKRNPTLVTNRTTTPATNTMDATHSDKKKGKQHQQHKQWKQHTRTTQKAKSKQATNTTTWHPQQNSKDTPKDSNRSIKWQPQE
jgi:hypothetical protein